MSQDSKKILIDFLAHFGILTDVGIRNTEQERTNTMQSILEIFNRELALAEKIAEQVGGRKANETLGEAITATVEALGPDGPSRAVVVTTLAESLII